MLAIKHALIPDTDVDTPRTIVVAPGCRVNADHCFINAENCILAGRNARIGAGIHCLFVLPGATYQLCGTATQVWRVGADGYAELAQTAQTVDFEPVAHQRQPRSRRSLAPAPTPAPAPAPTPRPSPVAGVKAWRDILFPPVPVPAPAAPAVPAAAPASSAHVLVHVKKSEASAEKPTCVVCMHNAIDTVVKPCRHAATCGECTVQLLRGGHPCPMCTRPIEKATAVYIA
jgi:hypothetical protein